MNSFGCVAWRRLNARRRCVGWQHAWLGLRVQQLALRGFHQHQIDRSHDAHEHVVDVVRDAGGEASDRFELLRLAKLLLELTPLGDVAHEAGHRLRAFGADARQRQFHRELCAVRSDGDQLELLAG